MSPPTLNSFNLTPSYSNCCLNTLTCSNLSSRQMYRLCSPCLACRAIFVRRYALAQCSMQLLRKFAVDLQSQTPANVVDKAKHYAAGTSKQQTQSTRRPARQCEGAAQLSCKLRPQVNSLIRPLASRSSRQTDVEFDRTTDTVQSAVKCGSDRETNKP